MCRECILKTAKALVEDTKLLVSGAGASQEKLAQAAQSSVTTITKLADVVKLGAASLGSEDPETQVPFVPLARWLTDTWREVDQPEYERPLMPISASGVFAVPPQVVLINAVKDVAKALGNLISTTKAAAGKPHDDPSMLQLKNSAKVSRSPR